MEIIGKYKGSLQFACLGIIKLMILIFSSKISPVREKTKIIL